MDIKRLKLEEPLSASEKLINHSVKIHSIMGNASTTPDVAEIIKANPELLVSQKGDPDSFDYRVKAFLKDDQSEVSMWHDIKLYPTPDSREKNIVNMINEIPRCSRRKFEIATQEPGNPIKQDVKKGKLREFLKVTPLIDSMLSYNVVRRVIFISTMDVFHRPGKIQMLSILMRKQKVTMIR
jgi:hypothetical protein